MKNGLQALEAKGKNTKKIQEGAELIREVFGLVKSGDV